MKIVYLSNDDIIDTLNFSIHTAPFHCRRMWRDVKVGYSKIIKGKLGELAMVKYCQMMGIKTKCNLAINEGVDDGDLSIFGCNVAVKTKGFSNLELPSFDKVFVHIPVDQYPGLVKNSIVAIFAVGLRCVDKKLDRWVNIPSVKAGIVGGLEYTEFDHLKILHRAGEEVAPGFILPPPDSWAVAWSKLLPVEVVINKIKTIKQ